MRINDANISHIPKSNHFEMISKNKSNNISFQILGKCGSYKNGLKLNLAWVFKFVFWTPYCY